jgi:hypothetical protein
MTQEQKERLTGRAIKGAKIRWQISMQAQLEKAHALLAEGKEDEAVALFAHLAAGGYKPAAEELAEMEYERQEGQYDGEV